MDGDMILPHGEASREDVPCRVALRQTFLQAGEKETALFLGRGKWSRTEEGGRLCCDFSEKLAPQTLSFPGEDGAAVTLESGGGRLRFPCRGEAKETVPLRISTPAGTLALLFTPLGVENCIDPASAKGRITLRYRLTDESGLLREAELVYTLL